MGLCVCVCVSMIEIILAGQHPFLLSAVSFWPLGKASIRLLPFCRDKILLDETCYAYLMHYHICNLN